MKIDREKLFSKFNGKCAYCGTELKKGWHADHIEPIVRNGKINNGCDFPERNNLENLNPACPSCNIAKHSQSLETFRRQIADTIRQLNLRVNLYKHAKRYGLISETNIEVKFYFESIKAE